ncbi:hypothetical protein MPSEU_000774600 [Mayamaea pseudoterrestris]|nr:hypothetical protein MPSEU_000182600 [Mayamaea pseudoterrestris]GKY98168.1 hypothetical protein MPSEU_000774600 [Mayamaea pseudoterrestris]
MWNVFGKKKAPEPSTVSATSVVRTSDPQVTIVKLRETISNQEKREEHIQRKIDTVVVEAKAKMAKGDKKGALACMKRKKMFEAEYDKIQNIKMTLETQVIGLESAAQNAETFKAMAQGTSAMQKIRTEIDVDQAEDIMEGVREEMELAGEINLAISGAVDMTDEDELMAELNALETADLEAELLAPPMTGLETLPTVPDSKMPKLAKKEEDDMKALEAELAAL